MQRWERAVNTLSVRRPHPHKVHRKCQAFPISKLGGWKHTTAFHESSKTDRHQALKHLRQHWCYGNRSVIGNRGRGWTLRDWNDIGLSPTSGRPETTPNYISNAARNTGISYVFWCTVNSYTNCTVALQGLRHFSKKVIYLSRGSNYIQSLPLLQSQR